MTVNSANFSISCIIPMHNEEENVSRVISEAEFILNRIALDWEIIVIESGSTDGTWKKIQEVSKDNRKIRAFKQEKREGMGSALRLAYSKCTKDLIFHLEADSPFDLAYFRRALPILTENDAVIGFRGGFREQRFKWAYSNMGNMIILTSLYYIGYTLLLRLMFGLLVRDVHFCSKLFKRNEINKLNLISNGWFIDAEVLLELKRNGILPIEIPIEYKDRTAGQSTVNLFTPCHMLYEMFRYIWMKRKENAK